MQQATTCYNSFHSLWGRRSNMLLVHLLFVVHSLCWRQKPLESFCRKSTCLGLRALPKTGADPGLLHLLLRLPPSAPKQAIRRTTQHRINRLTKKTRMQQTIKQEAILKIVTRQRRTHHQPVSTAQHIHATPSPLSSGFLRHHWTLLCAEFLPWYSVYCHAESR